MIARRHRIPPRHKPRGACLAFLAVATQVLVPFFLMVQIARANEPGGPAVICSALGHDADQDNGNAADHGLTAHCCSICTSLAATQGFAPPGALPLPLPVSAGRIITAAADIPLAAGFVTAAYQSRGPPSIV